MFNNCEDIATGTMPNAKNATACASRNQLHGRFEQQKISSNRFG
jgi:hypothetical protein